MQPNTTNYSQMDCDMNARDFHRRIHAFFSHRCNHEGLLAHSTTILCTLLANESGPRSLHFHLCEFYCTPPCCTQLLWFTFAVMFYLVNEMDLRSWSLCGVHTSTIDSSIGLTNNGRALSGYQKDKA